MSSFYNSDVGRSIRDSEDAPKSVMSLLARIMKMVDAKRRTTHNRKMNTYYRSDTSHSVSDSKDAPGLIISMLARLKNILNPTRRTGSNEAAEPESETLDRIQDWLREENVTLGPMGDRLTLAQRLLEDHPSKTLELLMDYLRDGGIQVETERYIGQHPPQRVPDAQFGWQYEDPPNSAGSVTSYASSLEATDMERIFLISLEDDIADQAAIARRTPGRHNLIGDEMAYGRGFSASQFEVDESILVHTSSGAARLVAVKAAMNLTWRRRNELTTNMDTFYIVSASLLDSDVVLGSEESKGRQFFSEVHDAHASQGRYPQGFVTVDDFDQAVQPRAPMLPTQPSYSYQPPSPDVERAFQRVSAMHEVQRMREPEPPTQAAISAPAYHSQQSDALITIPSRGDSSDELQVNGLWDTTPVSLSFNPDESGEKFFQVFLLWAQRRGRGGDVDRSRMMLWLKTNRDMPDDAAQDLSLDQDDLEDLWATKVAWIHENKSAQAPHLYATVQIIEMEDE